MARKHGRRWLADVRTETGERLRPSFPTQHEAEDWEDKARSAIAAGRPLPDQKVPKGGAKSASKLGTIGGLFEFVKATEWDHLRSAETAIKNGQDVVNYFGHKRGTDTIGAQDVAEMKTHFTSIGLAASTANRKAAALSKMLRVATDAGVIDKTPRFRWFPEEQTRFRVLDEVEEVVMLDYWRGTDHPLMADLCVLLIDTGARCFSEMVPVPWDAFAANFASVTFWQTKTNKPRTVPLTERCRTLLRARQKAAPGTKGPFYSSRGKSLSKNTMRHQWDAMRVATGLLDVTPHTLRHTCCTRLFMGGVDVPRVKTWMGHTSVATTMRYSLVRQTDLEAILHVMERKTA
jgi:integrase